MTAIRVCSRTCCGSRGNSPNMPAPRARVPAARVRFDLRRLRARSACPARCPPGRACTRPAREQRRNLIRIDCWNPPGAYSPKTCAQRTVGHACLLCGSGTQEVVLALSTGGDLGRMHRCDWRRWTGPGFAPYSTPARVCWNSGGESSPKMFGQQTVGRACLRYGSRWGSGPRAPMRSAKVDRTEFRALLNSSSGLLEFRQRKLAEMFGQRTVGRASAVRWEHEVRIPWSAMRAFASARPGTSKEQAMTYACGRCCRNSRSGNSPKFSAQQSPDHSYRSCTSGSTA
jgi:hypothetical protein